MQARQRALYFGLVLTLLFCGCRPEPTGKNETGLYLPGDLEATLWAESPLLHNPTNMDVDSKGRIWVTEAVDYRNYNNDPAKFLHHPQGDRIMILEDTDQDGKADSAKIFVQEKDLIAPLGIAVIGNKVIVSCSPNLIIYTDENGDDKPDKKEIFLSGFGGRDHDHSLHSVTAGPDGKWYFNTGNAGPHTVTDKSGWTLRSGSVYTGGSPYNDKNEGNRESDDGRIWVGGLALRINPDGTGLKVLGHNFRNSYEVVTDSYGNLWQNDNDDQVVACRTTWLMEGGNAGFFSNDGTRYWSADQRPGQDIFAAHWHQDDPGVMPAGDRTGAGSPTGVVVNEGDGLGKNYRGMLLSADAGRNVIFAYHPVISQSGYDLGKRTNLIASVGVDNEKYAWNDSAQNAEKDKWFRPSDVLIGTDGAMYVSDWYDPVVGGHQMKDTAAHGRIYRIAPKNKKLTVPRIDLSSVEGQIAALKNPAVNVRHLGFDKLRQQGATVIPQVRELLKDENGYVRARAAWLLSNLGEEGLKETEALLNDRDVLLRATAFRALRQQKNDILPYAARMAVDESAFVRREVAIALRDLPFVQTRGLLLQLVKTYDGEDRWFLETLGAAMENDAGFYYDAIRRDPGNLKHIANDFAWRLHPENAIDDLYNLAISPSVAPVESSRMLTALAFINHRSAAEKMLAASRSGSDRIKEQATYWLSFKQGNDWHNLLDWQKTGINAEYERKVASMKAKRDVIIDDRFSTDERRWRIQQMATDSIGGQMLIALAAENKIPVSLQSHVERLIFRNPDVSVRVQAGKYFKRPGTGKTYSPDAITALKADAGAGRLVFSQRCANCHKKGPEGSNIGPDLSLIHKKFDRTMLLDAIINPDAGIVFGYEAWLVNKKNGESIYGFLLSENKNGITVKDITGKNHVVRTVEISKKEKQSKSLMPDPIANGMNEKELADVVEYLLNSR